MGRTPAAHVSSENSSDTDPPGRGRRRHPSGHTRAEREQIAELEKEPARPPDPVGHDFRAEAPVTSQVLGPAV